MAKPKTEIITSSVARLLRQKRIAQGLSMYAVAKRARIAHSSLTRIENGLMKPTLDMLLRITEAMGMGLGALITEAENQSATQKKKNP